MKLHEDSTVVDVLNAVLTAELTAINQYFLHAEMCHNWGYERLYHEMRRHSIDEMKHAEKVMERILFLEGVPNVQRLNKINIGETVVEQLQSDMALEKSAVLELNQGVAICRDRHDNTTRNLLELVLAEEEEHVDWLEAQLTLIEQVGLPQYLAMQMHKAS